MLIVLILLLDACESGSADSRVDPTAVSSGATTVATGVPAPTAAWPLRGDGKASVGGLDLEFVGAHTITADGVAFDGVSGKAVTQGSAPLDTTDSMTLSAWVSYAGQLDDLPTAVLIQDSAGFYTIGNQWYFGTTDADSSGSPPVRRNRWAYLAGVWDREAGVIRFYVDGKLVDETQATAPLPAAGPLIIGGGDNTNAWDGAIVDVAVYQTALGADQIAEIYQTTRPDAPPPRWTPDPATYGDGILEGTWDYPLHEAKDQRFLDEFSADYGKPFDQASIRLGFDGPLWWQGVTVDGELAVTNHEKVGDIGIIELEGDRLTIRSWYGVTTYRWSLAGDELTLRYVSGCDAEGGACLTRDEIGASDPLVLLVMEHTFTKSGDDASY
jgi:hypothetical protein